MKILKKIIFLFVIMGISHPVIAACIVENGNNSGSGSLRQYLSVMQDLADGSCREADGTYRIWFTTDPDQNGTTDWDIVVLDLSLSVTNTQRTMTIGNNTVQIGINGRGLGRCMISVGENVVITFKTITLYTDANVTSAEDAICGTWIDGGNITVEPAEGEDTGGDTENKGGIRNGLFTKLQPKNIDWDRDGATRNEGDCAPTDPSIYPGASESCDGIDNNCDGEIDETYSFPLTVFYPDSDGDGYGDIHSTADQEIQACEDPGLGYSANQDDCDDSSASTNPASTYSECGGVDTNCDGTIDDSSEFCPAETDCSDGVDNDGNGLKDCSDPACATDSYCSGELGPEICDNVASNGDLVDDDGDGFANCDDSDCVSDTACAVSVDPTTIDQDGDGYCAAIECSDGSQPGDCDDDNDDVNPGMEGDFCASEDSAEIDNNCDQKIDSTNCIDPSGNEQPPDSGGCGCDLSAHGGPMNFQLILGFFTLFFMFVIRVRQRGMGSSIHFSLFK